MGNEINLNQNSREWLEWRKGGIGASDAPIIMGRSPWKTPYKLWVEKTTGRSDFKGNKATERGHDLEELARECAEKDMQTMFLPKCYQHDEYPWMRASLDGINMEGEILEIKCPFTPHSPKSDHQTALNGKIPEKYFFQLQHQLEVSGAKKGFFYSFDGEQGVAIPFERDEEFIADMLEKEKSFWECVQSLTPPKMTEKDCQLIEDKEALVKAKKVVELRKRLEGIQGELEPLEEDLKGYAQERNAIIGGLRVTRFVRKGGINYNAIPELDSVDLEGYRKQASIGFRLSEVK